MSLLSSASPVLVILLSIGLPLGTANPRAAKSIDCGWRLVADAFSEIYLRCLRLFTKPCYCERGACNRVNRIYNVTVLEPSYPCTNQITWCEWGPWTAGARVIVGTTCLRAYGRRRDCCVRFNHDRRRRVWTPPGTSPWRCRGAGIEQTRNEISCQDRKAPGPAAVLPLTLFEVVICILILITLAILVRIICGTKLSACCRRAVGIPVRSQRNTAETPSDRNSPPSYNDAVDNFSSPPTYDEAIGSNMHLNNIPPRTEDLLNIGEVATVGAQQSETSDRANGILQQPLNTELDVNQPVNRSMPQPVSASYQTQNNENLMEDGAISVNEVCYENDAYVADHALNTAPSSADDSRSATEQTESKHDQSNSSKISSTQEFENSTDVDKNETNK